MMPAPVVRLDRAPAHRDSARLRLDEAEAAPPEQPPQRARLSIIIEPDQEQHASAR